MDVNTVVATGVRASLVESKMYAKSEVTTQPRNIRFAKLRATSELANLVNTGQIRNNDRVLDEKTQITWLILDIVPMQNPVIGQDIRIDLQYVG
jgi:hypothetical protein